MDGGITLTGVTGTCPANLVIPSTYDGYSVLGLAPRFLSDSTALQTVTISEGVATIGAFAFSGCGNLRCIELPSSLVEVQPAAFTVDGKISLYGSSKLSEIKVASDNGRFYVNEGILVDGMSQTAIVAVRNVTSVNLPDSVVSIGMRCFSGCSKLKKIYCGTNLEAIEKEAFLFCRKLKTISLQDTQIRAVAIKAFSGCDSLPQIEFPNTLEELSVHSFRWCNSLIKVVMHGNAPKITSYETDEWGTANQYPYVTSNVNLDNFPWSGNAYIKGGRPLTSVTTYVEPGTEGWGTVPGTWQECPIRYIGDEPSIEEEYGPYIPGESFVIDTGLIGYTAKGLPSGLKYDAKTGKITGAATKPTGADGATVTFNKKGEETQIITIVIGPIPTVAVELVGDTEKCKVTGAKAYLADKKVSLSASAPKGTAFVGWFDDEALVSSASKYSFTMPTNDVALTAKFEKEKMSVACAGLSMGDFRVGVAGGLSGIPLEISTQSGVKSVKATKLPTGMKLVKDKKTGEWSITGSPTKAGAYNVVLTVTAVSGATESVTIPVTVEALPAWVCGTFGGMIGKHVGADGDDFRPYGMITLKITSNGKITAKIIAGGKSYSFSGTGFESVDESEDYYFKLTTKKGEVYEGVIAKGYHDVATMVKGGFVDEPDGVFTMADGRSYWAGVWRNEHGKDGRLSTDTSGKARKVMDAIKALKNINLAEVDPNYGTVKMTIDAKGSVKFAGKTSDGFMVSGSTFLMLDDDCYHVMADMAFYDKKSGNVYNITPCWQPIFNQQGDIVNWDEKCCDHSLRTYPFE